MRDEEVPREHGSAWQIFVAFLRLGCTSFGGPVAHLGYFRAEFVERRAWVSDGTFAELLGLAQSLPGPASSQLGFAIGLVRGGAWGGLAAWLGFTLPSALLMLGFGLGRATFTGAAERAVLHGLQLVAVAVVAQAVLAMQQQLAPDCRRQGIALAAAAIALFSPATSGTMIAIVFGLLAGQLLLKKSEASLPSWSAAGTSRRAACIACGVFAFGLLCSLRLAGDGLSLLTLFAKFYRAGALVFGGGHVVMPLLEQATVGAGWISPQGFLAGYGAAQALPGPLFTFAAYLGAAVQPNPHPLLFGLDAMVAIFLPGLLLMAAALPFWSALRRHGRVRTGLQGINAAVVGVLAAAFYSPVWTSSVHTRLDFWLVLVAFAALVFWKVQPWMVALGAGACCWLVQSTHGPQL